MSRFVPRINPFYLLLLAAGGTANAQSTFEQKAANPFDNNNDGLPDLGMAPENHDGEKHFAEIVKDFGETSMNDNGLDTGEQAKAFALGKVRDGMQQAMFRPRGHRRRRRGRPQCFEDQGTPTRKQVVTRRTRGGTRGCAVAQRHNSAMVRRMCSSP